MNRKSIVTLALLLASTSALAAEPPARGFYVGANAGVTSFEDDGVFAGAHFDDSDTAYGIYGGYKILKYLAVEARISNQGSYGVSNGFEHESFDVTVYSAHVVGIIPFGTSGWELFGQLGIGSLNLDSRHFGDDNTTVGSAGIGVRYYPTSHLGLAVETDAYAWEEDGFGSNRDLGVAATQLAVHYIF
ncbi:MAG TPA: porin family protein [Steroidobacteraceae bacterium]